MAVSYGAEWRGVDASSSILEPAYDSPELMIASEWEKEKNGPQLLVP